METAPAQTRIDTSVGSEPVRSAWPRENCRTARGSLRSASRSRAQMRGSRCEGHQFRGGRRTNTAAAPTAAQATTAAATNNGWRPLPSRPIATASGAVP